MLSNYFKIAWRNILRNKVSSFINISGLAIGISCVILILLYVQDELQYDRFFHTADRICQVNISGNFGGEEFYVSNTPPTVGPALASEIPEIETYTRIYHPGDLVVRNEGSSQVENYFTEPGVLAVDSNFLQVFTFPMVEGDPASCLQHNNAVVITEKIARKYFGNGDAMGKTLLIDNSRTPFTVSGILKDLPAQSSLQFDLLTPVSAFPVVKQFSWSWVWLQVSTYVKLRDHVSNDAKTLSRLEAKFPDVVKKHAASAFNRIGQPYDEFIKKGGRWDFHLQPFRDIHLYSAGIGVRWMAVSDIKYLYIFSIIALFIIILACVNFMNLSTAQSAQRAKEVGIRKVMGSEKNQLIRQFLTEALLYSFIATLIAILIVISVLHPFNQLAGKTLQFSSFFKNGILLIVLSLSVITGLVAGSYPAFYLTSFKPIAVLKGIKELKSGIGDRFIRSGLVVFQFTISTILIIATIIVYQQMQYARNKDLGLNKDNLIVIENANRLDESKESFREEILKMPEVVNASISTSIPTKDSFGDLYIPEKSAADPQVVKDIGLSSYMVDDNFIPTLAITMVTGRNFSPDYADSTSVILNETAVKQIGWKDPIGKYLEYPGNNNQRFKVIGVAKDFNVESLRNPVVPFALFHTSSKTYDIGTACVIARVRTGSMNSSLSELESKWKSFIADAPFDYSFLDSEFNALYRADQRMGTVFGLFTILSIFVACLGLFGLSAYMAERRTKEIGVRKVLGASVKSLVALLSKDFVKLVLIATVIAFPIAWWVMNQWLEDFAFRITITWWIFAASTSIALIIALFTVSFQAIKAAIANPVKSLRTE